MAEQRWKVGLQAEPHWPALQVAVLLSGAAQGVHEVPQLAGSLLDRQALPHA